MERGSYLLIQKGMPISGPEGSLGSVHEVIADISSDVFRGIVIATGLLARHLHFIAADEVVSVTETGVEVNLKKSNIDQMPQYDPSDPAHAGKVHSNELRN